MSEQKAPTTEAHAETAPEAQLPSETTPESATTEPTLGTPAKRRRTTKVDTVLAGAKDVALAAVQEIAPEGAIGPVHHLKGEEDRLTTHLFECSLAGYRGWFWFATLSRVPRSKQATVCEVGLIPGDDALLAPAWVPWAERIQEGDEEAFAAEYDEDGAADTEEAEELTESPEAPATSDTETNDTETSEED